MKYTYVCIEYANPLNFEDQILLKYKLRSNSVVPKWISKIHEAWDRGYNIDDPTRFYGLKSLEAEKQDAINRVNQCIKTINSHRHLIKRFLTDVNDEEFLNSLHFMFEQYHGLLDNQTHEIFTSASNEVKQAFANLNIDIHRCESVARGNEPRHVVTYYGLPKVDTLDISEYDLFDDVLKFGTVYLNYAEIGKTLENLAMDDDEHLFDQEFQPYKHYSADFCVLFSDSNPKYLESRREKIKNYYDKHRDFFENKGLDFNHPYLRLGKLPMADLEIDINKDEVLELLKQHQYVKRVYFL